MPATNITNGLDAIRALLSCIHADGLRDTSTIIIENNEAVLKKLTLDGLSQNMLLLNVDNGRKVSNKIVHVSPLFSTTSGFDHNRACDAVLIKSNHDGIEICYIEMKSGKPSGFEGQFVSTHCFMHYIINLAKEMCGVDVSISRERYVIFHTDPSGQRSGKRPKPMFQPLSRNRPDSPDKFIVCNDDTLRITTFF